jgi:hypothetical protein
MLKWIKTEALHLPLDSPLWHINFKLFGNALINSSSYFPVVARLEGARSHITVTPSSFPLLHSSINSDLLVAEAVMSSPCAESAFHEVVALGTGF